MTASIEPETAASRHMRRRRPEAGPAPVSWIGPGGDPSIDGLLATELGEAVGAGLNVAEAMVMRSPLVQQIHRDGLGDASYQVPNPGRSSGAVVDLTAESASTEVGAEQSMALVWHQVARGGLVPVTLRASNAVVTEVDRGTVASNWATFRQVLLDLSAQPNTTAILVERRLDTSVSGTAEPLLDRSRWRIRVEGSGQSREGLMSVWFGLSRGDRRLLGPKGRHRELARLARVLRRGPSAGPPMSTDEFVWSGCRQRRDAEAIAEVRPTF
jgi:hypothetical protein